MDIIAPLTCHHPTVPVIISLIAYLFSDRRFIFIEICVVARSVSTWVMSQE